ncbi:calcium/sodium antiporter [Candidatus Saccharibacteria bacterium]|nr:calcium/sodium antiporter [Candidatus Saccharibacteria bacterium]
MEIFGQILLLLFGFAILIKGADWLVDGASSVASNFKVSKQVIGLTIVAFGTGAPEFAVSISSMLSGNTDMLLGNVLGSNIINILLLIGVAALISPIKINRSTISKELPLLLLTSIGLVFLFLDASISGSSNNLITRGDGLVLILFFAIFLYYILAMIRRSRSETKVVEKPKWKLPLSFLFVILGLVGVVAGSQFVVSSASFLASAIGISDRIIALTVVAFGTSLPELVTTITAARRHENELLVGNIIGSNIFNICIVLGLPVAIFGAVEPKSFEMLDVIMMVASAALLWFVARKGSPISKKEGAIMLLVFAGYYGFIIYNTVSSMV